MRRCGPVVLTNESTDDGAVSPMVIVAIFAARLVFGASISPAFLESIGPANYLFAVLMLVAVRPAALLFSLVGSRLNWRERIVAAWFGPKGFASVTFGLMILKAGMPDANELFHLCALVIFGSIVAHSSTDVVVARWFSRTRERR